MQERREASVLGVVGGMGALASAEFVKTVYESCPPGPEQSAPIVILYSDPTFPDRTEAFLGGREDEVLRRLLDVLGRLRDLGAARIVLACVTLHHLLPLLPSETRRSIVSILDVVFSSLQASAGGERHLLLCSTGARRLKLFEKHAAWDRSKDRIVLLDEEDQIRLHGLILRVKENRGLAEMLSFLESLSSKYSVASLIAGCSELHIVAKHLVADVDGPGPKHWVDPFTDLARRWVSGPPLTFGEGHRT